jgi:murein L,D-transpeptidase YafK
VRAPEQETFDGPLAAEHQVDERERRPVHPVSGSSASAAWGHDRPLSALRNPRIVVEKSRRRLSVYDGDRLVKQYIVATGGGRGDKAVEGDRCTPEGRFYVCNKNPRSQYVLALGLSYPNREDAARGLRDGLIDRKQHRLIVEAIRDRRRPPWNTPLGGEIMIHGRRDGREDTLGCIALDDDAIRELYPRVDVGTLVRIVP